MKLNLFPNKPSTKEMAEYRKRIKIYDIFTFFNELELLEIRLNILAPFVDYFVIVESTETFSGIPKKLIFKENKERFKKFEKKIMHYAVKDTPADENNLHNRLCNDKLNDLDREIINNVLTSDNVPKGIIHWLKEFYQKEMIKKALIDIRDDDICFISDVDEIWNPEAQINFTKDDIFKLRQNVYAYYVNNRSSEPWAGTLVTKYKNIKNNCLNHLRTATKTKYTYVKNGGWHFTNQGGAERIKQKLEASYGQEDYNTEGIKSQINQKMNNNQDYIGRGFKFWLDEAGLPQYLLDNKEKYKHLFKIQLKTKKNTDSLIIIKIQGGLGNQLFQYALGRNLSLSRNLQVRYDLSWFGAQTKRKYELDKLQTIIDLIPNHETEKLRQYQKKSWLRHPIHNLLIADSKKYIQEKNICFDPNIILIKPPAYLDGHWMSEKYFSKIAAQLREDLQPKNIPTGENAKMLEAIVRQEAVAVHIRRGDYIQERQTNKFHGTTTIEYYQQATDYILKKIKQPIFYIFSDDLEWAKNNIHINAPIILVSQNGVNQAHEDLRLMYSCKHFIVANSTFSWWGAWLSAYPKKIVITPKKWFTNQRINIKDLLPRSWIKI